MAQRRVHNKYQVIIKSTKDPAPAPRAMITGAPKDAPRVICPVCGELVPTRNDGSIRGHRVGTSRKNSWPCIVNS